MVAAEALLAESRVANSTLARLFGMEPGPSISPDEKDIPPVLELFPCPFFAVVLKSTTHQTTVMSMRLM